MVPNLCRRARGSEQFKPPWAYTRSEVQNDNSGSGGYSRRALGGSSLLCDPALASCLVAGADICWVGAGGFCCAGVGAREGGLVAKGGAVSVSLRCARAAGWRLKF